MKKKKYPRTYHLPWSLGSTSDDKFMPSTECFEGKEVVVTIKMDGENTTMGCDYIHARSMDSRHHWSRSWVKQLHSTMKSQIPDGWRICGENLFAQHSIAYDDLKSFFYLFSVWDEKNYALSWDETKEIAQMLGLELVKEIYRGPWSIEKIKSIELDCEKNEGYVVRNANSFHYDDFASNVGKFVREKHVQTDQHWMYSTPVKNRIKNDV